jgi:hypothetical protein
VVLCADQNHGIASIALHDVLVQVPGSVFFPGKSIGYAGSEARNGSPGADQLD